MFKKSFEKVAIFFSESKEVLRMTVFTIFAILCLRILSFVVMPGIKLKQNITGSGIEFLDLVALLGGNLMSRFSIVSLGVSPYITASVIIQLLSTGLVPVLSRWRKLGRKGQMKIEICQRIVTVPLAILQGLALIFSSYSQGFIEIRWDGYDISPVFYYFSICFLLIMGVYISLWIADQINVRGLGNGVSIVIFSGIAAALPQKMIGAARWWIQWSELDPLLTFLGIVKFFVYFLFFLAVVYFIVVCSQSELRLPVKQGAIIFTASSESRQQEKAYFPIRVNAAGVIPVIFSSAVISIPMSIAQWVAINNPESGFIVFVQQYISQRSVGGNVLNFFLVVLFTFAYVQIQLDPEKIAENFQKNNVYILNIQPGEETRKYLARKIFLMSFPGALFLAGLVVLPFVISLISSLSPVLAIGATGIIILVGVSVDILRQLKSFLIQKRFFRESFIPSA